MIIGIGLDDFDSPLAGCTTYVASLLVEKLSRLDWIKFLDYPHLIRLNPNIPFKTRGNGAVSLLIRTSDNHFKDLINLLNKFMENAYWESHEKTDPVLVIISLDRKEKVERLRKLYFKALTTLVTYDYAKDVAEEVNAIIFKVKKGRGLIGALASIGADLSSDYTFELLTYREKKMWGKPREIDHDSVLKYDRITRPYTFNNIDYESRRILITPHGPDPVLYGIRGDNPRMLIKALEIIKVKEKVDRWLIFKTNQGTDAHLFILKKICDIRPYDSVGVRGKIVENPVILKGGHVKFKISDDTGVLECMVYNETGYLNKVSRLLRINDIVEVWGGIKPKSYKHSLTLNVEKIRILKVSKEVILRNPRCPVCGTTMKSLGKNKGFKCKKCKFRSKDLHKVEEKVPRILEPGVYIASTKAHRHLTKPLSRYGFKIMKDLAIISLPWHMP